MPCNANTSKSRFEQVRDFKDVRLESRIVICRPIYSLMMSTRVLPSAWHGVAAPLDLAVPSQLLLISVSAPTINNS
jgi:hypothetical protein